MKPLISKESPLLLASTSRYRAQLLSRLGVPFEAVAPGTDEAPLPDEAPAHLALRLARSKAADVAARHPGRWVLGSDQVPAIESRSVLQISKPSEPGRLEAKTSSRPSRRIEG